MSLAAVSEDLALRYESSATTDTGHADLERALRMQREALGNVAQGHPDHVQMTICLAKLLLIPHSPYTDFENAFSMLVHKLRHARSNVYRCVLGLIPLLENVEANLASNLRETSTAHKQCLDVYQILIDLLPRMASLDMDLPSRIQVLVQARDLATRAFMHAAKLMQFDHAIELLEAGRAVFWAQHLRLRSSFDSIDDDTAKELREISGRLESSAGSNIPPDLDDNLSRARMERVMNERRQYSIKFDQLVDQVRSQPGMDGFLRNLGYKALSLAAKHGPVVVLQASWMCVIAAPHTSPKAVPIHGMSNEWLHRASQASRQSVHANYTRLDSRGARKRLVGDTKKYVSEEYNVLEELWLRIAQPLLSLLGWTVSYKLISRRH
jgi:hypothetical protein